MTCAPKCTGAPKCEWGARKIRLLRLVYIYVFLRSRGAIMYRVPINFGALCKSKYNLTFWYTCHKPYMCAWWQAPVSLAAAPRREGTITMRAAGCMPAWAPKELKISLTLLEKGFHLQLNSPKGVGGWGSAPDPPIARESAFGACLSYRVENGVNAIQKWVPFTPKYSKKRWRLGLRPRPPNSNGDRLQRLPV